MIYKISETLFKNVLSLPPDVIIYDSQSGHTHVLHPPVSNSFLKLRSTLKSRSVSNMVSFDSGDVFPGKELDQDATFMLNELVSLEVLTVVEDGR